MGNKKVPKGRQKSPKRADQADRARGARDPRYNLIQALLRNGQIHSFDQVFDYVPITVVASDLHIKASTLHKYLADGMSIKLKHILTVSAFCELTDRELIRLVITFLQRKEAEKRAKIEKTDALVERIKGVRSSEKQNTH
jgi:hypothetical protein